MLTSLIYVFAFVFVLSLVVIVHEWGHFFIARRCGVKVTDFSIGFGQELWHHIDKKGTRWKVCWLPLGGYVKMLGDEDAASAKASTKHIKKSEIKYTFMAQPLWKRAAIIFAGPAMNYLSAFVLLTGLIMALGEVIVPPVIGEILPDSAAEEAGLQIGDKFVSINGTPVREYTDVLRAVRITDFEKPLTIVIERNGVQSSVSLTPRYHKDHEFPLIGIRAATEYATVNEHIGPVRAVQTAATDIYKMTADTLIYLKQVLFEHRSAKDMRGPLGIAEASGDAMRGGVLSLLMFIVQISVAIGFMNLLPIPVLDGGHLFFYAVEAVCRRPIPERIQNGFLGAGVGLLLLLVAYTMFLDVPRILQRIIE